MFVSDISNSSYVSIPVLKAGPKEMKDTWYLPTIQS